MRISQFPDPELSPKGFRGQLARALGNLAIVRGLPSLARLPFRTIPEFRQAVPPTFFGINVAPGLSPAHDEYTLERIGELGIRQVRIDFPQRENTLHRRLLKRLHESDLEVLLHLVQSPRTASRMAHPDEQREWSEFIRERIASRGSFREIELGSTPNRFRFSGYTLRSLVSAIEVAAPPLEAAGIPWCAPGLSDFEPLFLDAFLSLLGRRGLRPGAVTCNLHVDRAGGPENFDPHVAGERLCRLMSLDLQRKIQVLARIASDRGVQHTWCGFFSWTLLQDQWGHPRYVDEDQQANYICRYLLLAAATSGLDRVFVGPLVSHSRGLVDGLPGERNFPPSVVLSPPIRGDVREFRQRESYAVVRWLARLLPGAGVLGRLPTPPGAHALGFRTNKGEFWMALWTGNGVQVELDRQAMASEPGCPVAHDRTGQPLIEIPQRVGEAPIFFHLRPRSGNPDFQNWSPSPWFSSRQPIVVPLRSSGPGFQIEDWRGYRGILADGVKEALPETDSSGRLLFPDQFLVRETRHGRIFRIPLAGNAPLLQVKEFPPRRLLRGRRTVAFQVWSNLLAAQRRNLQVATPLGYLEPGGPNSGGSSYLLTRFESRAVSLRRLSAEPGPAAREEEARLYFRAGSTIRRWHQAGVFHGDLSIGNLLSIPDREELLIVDLDRARFRQRLGRWSRLRDLARVRVPRQADPGFLSGYFGNATLLDRFGLNLARRLYRGKQGTKRLLRGIWE